jgi:hypothetical protein
MNRCNLLIFIDSFPYRYVDRSPFLSRHRQQVQKVLPGFGYSINLKAEIFGGYFPDQAGFLNEWSYDARSPLRKYRSFFRLLGPFQKWYFADRLVHKILSRLLGYNILNIPLRYLAFFSKNGTEAYRDEFHLPTLFSHMRNLKKICYYHYGYGPKRDSLIFSDMMKAISADYDNIFGAFGDLDGIGHSDGVGAEKYDLKIAELDRYLSALYEAFRRRNPEGTFIVFSDHGMANVHQGISIDMESHFGEASESRYLYFIDATMLRVWCFDKRTQNAIERHLGTLDCGKVLNTKQRAYEGISSPLLADIIFQLDEGFVFRPSFMGRKMPLAMHGYSSSFENQAGFCLSSDSAETPAGHPFDLRTIDLYDFLKTQTGIS